MPGPGGTIDLTNGDDLFPGVGDDNSGNETVNGLDGQDGIFGGLGNDVLNGGAGNDFLDGSEGDDTLSGGDGNDDLFEDFSGTSTVDGGAGDDTLTVTSLIAGGVLMGGTDTDTLFAQFVDLTLFTLSGLEILIAIDTTGTAAQFESFDVIDRAQLAMAAIGSPQTLDIADELNFGVVPRDALVVGSSDDEAITTGDGQDDVQGGDGNDILNTGLAEDFLDGGLGDDTLNGGAGIDLGLYLFAPGGVTVDLAILAPQDTTSYGMDTLVAIEILWGSGFDDRLAGNGANNELVGMTGNDRLFGAAGADSLYGGFGDDSISGGDGNDTIFGADDADNLSGDAGADLIFGGLGSDDAHGGDGNDNINGEDGDDARLAGDGGSDRVSGGLGNDRIDGGDGDDILLKGEEGTDSIHGGLGNDTLDGGADKDTLYGDDNDDRVLGGNGNDRLLGGAGNDRLIGGTGNDVLLGGSGLDVFVFRNRTEGNDRIDDWVAADDQIEIDASAFGGGLAAGPLAPNQLVVGAAPVANQAFGQFLYDTVTGRLSWDADGTGAGAMITVARLLNSGLPAATLAAADFDIVA